MRRAIKEWRLAGLLFLVPASLVAAILLGVADIPLAQVLAVLRGDAPQAATLIILDIRLPRVLAGALAGTHFALSGLLLQRITHNPLADPSLLGISQGATLAVTLFLLAGPAREAMAGHSLTALPVAWMPLAGTLGGLAAGATIHLMALRHGLGPLRITLCGIAVGAVLQALALGLIAGWGSARIEVLMEWISGSLYARSWRHVVFLLPFTVLGLAALLPLRRSIALLGLDRLAALSFGLDYRLHFSLVLMLACMLAASAVGVVGPIAFVGLVVPHLARLLAGQRPQLVLPLCIALGVVLVTLGDLAGRVIGGAEEIPIGVVTALLGVPILVLLLRRPARGHG